MPSDLDLETSKKVMAMGQTIVGQRVEVWWGASYRKWFPGVVSARNEGLHTISCAILGRICNIHSSESA